MKLWCNHCDMRQVDSTDKTTGKYYMAWGHVLRGSTPKGVKIIRDPYEAVIFAVCPDCDSKVHIIELEEQEITTDKEV